jgi:trimeric autotransporter adhesin
MAANSEQVAYEAAGIVCRRAAAVTAAAATFKTWLDEQGSLDDARAALMVAARTSNNPARVLLRATQAYTELTADAVLVSIAITGTDTVVGTATSQLTATGTYSDGLTHNITTTVSWTSATPAHATVGLHTGLVTGVAAGTTVITATGPGPVTATVTVTAS